MVKLSSMSFFKSKLTFPFNFKTIIDQILVIISIIILSISKKKAVLIIVSLLKFSKYPSIFPSYIGESRDIRAYTILNIITNIESILYFL